MKSLYILLASLIAVILPLVFFTPRAFSEGCLTHLRAYNLNYEKSSDGGEPRDLYKKELLNFLKTKTSEEVRTLSYFLASDVIHPMALDENLENIRSAIKAPLKSDDSQVIQGHSVINISEIKDQEALNEVAKFLFIQTVTNADLKRASHNFKELSICPTLKIFK